MFLKLLPYFWSLLVVILCTFIGAVLRNILNPIDQIMLYLMASIFVAANLGRNPAIFYAILSVSSFNFFFVEPFYTFMVYDKSYWLTFIVMLITSLVISTQVRKKRTALEKAELSKIETETEKLKNSLLSSVSHDLRTPLATISGASSSIALDYKNMPRETIKNLANSIQKESSRLANIVTNLMHIGKLEANSLTLNKEPYYIEELVGSVLTRMEAQLAEYNIIKHADPELPVITIDAVLIEQVITNLLENAIKYTKKGNNIYIFVNINKTEIKVTIADSGQGIIPGNEQKIFEKFYTEEKTNKHNNSGLGLTICKGIIEAHKGKIWAENRLEGGTKVTFTLPILPL